MKDSLEESSEYLLIVHFVATSVGLANVHLEFQVVPQHSQCFDFLDDYLLFFLDQIAVSRVARDVIFKVHLSRCHFFLASKRMLKFNKKINEVLRADPSSRLRVVVFPKVNEVVDIVTAHNAQVFLLGLLEALDDRGDRQVHDQHRNQDDEAEEVDERHPGTAA